MFFLAIAFEKLGYKRCLIAYDALNPIKEVSPNNVSESLDFNHFSIFCFESESIDNPLSELIKHRSQFGQPLPRPYGSPQPSCPK